MATTTTGSTDTPTDAVATGADAAGASAGAARDAVTAGVGQVKALAKKQPFAFAALAGVLGVALINTLRGRR